jgi:hypothetical protein
MTGEADYLKSVYTMGKEGRVSSDAIGEYAGTDGSVLEESTTVVITNLEEIRNTSSARVA